MKMEGLLRQFSEHLASCHIEERPNFCRYFVRHYYYFACIGIVIVNVVQILLFIMLALFIIVLLMSALFILALWMLVRLIMALLMLPKLLIMALWMLVRLVIALLMLVLLYATCVNKNENKDRQKNNF